MSDRVLSLLGATLLVAAPTARAAVPAIDTAAVVKQVNLCKLAHAFIKAPCAGKLLGERILPFLQPIDVTGLRASQTLIDLDTRDWKAKVAGWINKGLDWLGLDDSFRIPKRIGYDIGISLRLSDLRLAIPRGREYQPEFRGTIGVSLKVLSRGPFQNKTFSVKGTVAGKMYLTVAPLGAECERGQPPFTMAVVNLQLTRLDVDKIPDFIDGSDLFRKLVNWAINKVYDDYPRYHTRGIGICIQGKCPLPKRRKPAGGGGGSGILKLGDAQARNRYLSVRMTQGGRPEVRITDASLFCNVIDAVVRSGCTDAFVNSMASALLPLSVPLPAVGGVQGLSVSASAFRLGITRRNEMVMTATASVSKKGQRERLDATLGVKLEIRPQCTARGFLLFAKPTILSASMSRLPRWLLDEAVRLAVGTSLKPMDFCFRNFPIPKLGKSINACRITEALLEERCTGPFVNTVLGAMFPLSVRPEQAAFVTDATLRALLRGIRVTVEKVGVQLPAGQERNPRVSVRVAISREGEREVLRTSGTATLGIQTKCGQRENAVRLTPTLGGVQVSRIPDWLLKTTVVMLGNLALSRWQALCVYGDCKSKQRIDVRMPIAMPRGGKQRAAAVCNFDTFAGGR